MKVESLAEWEPLGSVGESGSVNNQIKQTNMTVTDIHADPTIKSLCILMDSFFWRGTIGLG